MKTNAWDKLLVSVINTAVIVLASVPFFVIWGLSLEYRLSLIGLFLLYQLVILFFPGRRSLGAIVTKTVWLQRYPLSSHLIYAFLYTASFATLVIWVYVPFDLLLVNLLLIQWPMVHFTGYTLHGFLSGKMAGTKQ